MANNQYRFLSKAAFSLLKKHFMGGGGPSSNISTEDRVDLISDVIQPNIDDGTIVLPTSVTGGDTVFVNDGTGGNDPSSAAPQTTPAGISANDKVVEVFDDNLVFWTFDNPGWTKDATYSGGGGGGAVDSVFGRTGAVVAVAGDYDDAEITAAGSATNYTPASATVDGHLVGIDAALASSGGGATIYEASGASTGWWINGNAGATATSGAAGNYTIIVPATGVGSIHKWFTNFGTELTAGGEAIITINFSGTGDFNQAAIDTIWPKVGIRDSGGSIREPNNVSVTPVAADGSGGAVVVTIPNLNGLGSPVGIMLNF